MKFTKEEAYKDLVAAMTAKGEKLNLSERSFNEQLDKLIPLVANDETELKDFIASVLPFFKTADANVRNDVSVGINEYKKQNPVTAPVVQQQVEEKKEDNKEFNELLSRFNALETKMKETEAKENASKVRAQVIAKVKEKGVKDTEWISSLLNDVVITEDFDVDAKAEGYVKIYNKMMADFDPSATSGSSVGGKGKNTVQDVIKAAADKQKQQYGYSNV